ncbi:MAG: hypothetical protein CFH10_00093 [Alphaproteobacteria bacterium MarineAlpha4_Bin2]|nr:MAG: hypothetical protein CFH10_00093 [Alphaproteobacteria bacterium MarineAlpha4_Bin2]
MNKNTERLERFTVEGFLEGNWHLVMSSNERDTAIRGAGSVVVSGAFEHVRIMINGVVPGVGRELVRVDRQGTVRNGAYVKDIGVPHPPSENAVSASDGTMTSMRPIAKLLAAGTLFAVGLAVGNWAVQVI